MNRQGQFSDLLSLNNTGIAAINSCYFLTATNPSSSATVAIINSI